MIEFEIRTGFESNRLLIEFSVVSADVFMSSWQLVLPNFKAKLVSEEDVWQNDEYIYRYQSPFGKFFLSISNYDTAFVMADDFELENGDNSVITSVAKVLAASNKFVVKPE